MLASNAIKRGHGQQKINVEANEINFDVKSKPLRAVSACAYAIRTRPGLELFKWKDQIGKLIKTDFSCTIFNIYLTKPNAMQTKQKHKEQTETKIQCLILPNLFFIISLK